MYNTDFSKVTPCGGNCTSCDYFKRNECDGCINNGGKCVKMWQNGCEIYSCCQKHNAKFCGLCSQFPCDWIVHKISEWDKGGIEKLKRLGIEYNIVINGED